MTHARRDIIDDIIDALGNTSPAVLVYEGDETADAVPAFYVTIESEERVEAETTRDRFRRTMRLVVTARGASAQERDDLSEQLEDALLLGGIGHEVDLSGVEFPTPDHESGARTWAAVYSLDVHYFTARADPSTAI